MKQSDVEPKGTPINVGFVYKTNVTWMDGNVMTDVRRSFRLFDKDRDSKLFLDQLDAMNKEFKTLPYKARLIWCMNIYSLVKWGILKNDHWNGVTYITN